MLKPHIPNEHLIHGYVSFAERKYSILDWINIWISSLFIWLLSLPLRVGGKPLKEALIRGLSGFFHFFLRNKRKIALINLDLVYGDVMPEHRKQEITRAMFTHFTRMVIDLMFSELYWPRDKLREQVGDANTRHVEACRNLGRGYALIAGHIGNLEMVQAVAVGREYSVTAVFKGFTNPWFDLFVGRKRLERGNGLIEIPSSRHNIVRGRRVKVEQRGIRTLVEDIWDQGGGVAFACDQYARRSRIKMPFLGIPNCPMQVGLMRYVIKNKIPFTMHALVYNEDLDPKWICSEPVFIEDKESHDETLRYYMTKMNDWLEARIHEYPEQFYWGHRRFPRQYYKRSRPLN